MLAATRPSAVPLPVRRLALAVTCVAAGAAALPAPSPAQERPNPQAMRVPTLSPELEATLQAWYDATKGVKKLEGRHTEVKSDDTFQSETHSVGRFYYEAPDKGRIDLGPRPADQCRPRRRPGGKPYAVDQGEVRRWICDGEKLLAVNEEKREVNVTDLPPQHRGEGIMNGPLPFLLGMPPELVKRRFRVNFPPGAQFQPPKGNLRGWLADPSSDVVLFVQPLLRQDSENWEQAIVFLSKPDFLPIRVKLTGTGGKSDTIYEFSDLKPNQSGLLVWLKGDPFKPNLRGYQIIPQNVAGGGPGGGNAAPRQGPGVPPVALPQTVPSVVGLPAAYAERQLAARKYQVKKYRGDATNNKALVGKVQIQQHKPGTPLPAGQVVGLKIWVAPVRQAGAERSAAK